MIAVVCYFVLPLYFLIPSGLEVDLLKKKQRKDSLTLSLKEKESIVSPQKTELSSFLAKHTARIC